MYHRVLLPSVHANFGHLGGGCIHATIGTIIILKMDMIHETNAPIFSCQPFDKYKNYQNVEPLYNTCRPLLDLMGS